MLDRESPEVPSYRSCPASTFPSILDIPLPFCGVPWVVSLCLREPGRVGTASSSIQLWALQLWGLPCYVGSRFGSRGRFFSAACLTFSLPGSALTRCWALGSLPCLARGGSPVCPSSASCRDDRSLEGSQEKAEPPRCPGMWCGQDAVLAQSPAGSQAWHMLEPSCQSL